MKFAVAVYKEFYDTYKYRYVPVSSREEARIKANELADILEEENFHHGKSAVYYIEDMEETELRNELFRIINGDVPKWVLEDLG